LDLLIPVLGFEFAKYCAHPLFLPDGCTKVMKEQRRGAVRAIESHGPAIKEDRLMKVLVVEDDPALGQFLQKGLKLEGHDVDWVADGVAALERAWNDRPQLVLLDLSLPKKDGIEVLAEMRGRFDGTAVLVLSGRCDVAERVQCLNLGADDCLLKPFSFHELMARCRALLRRRQMYSDPMLRHGELELNRIEHRVMHRGRVVDLTVKEFALLEFLMQREGRCCSRSELLREVWHMSPDAGTNVVDVYINYLRKKLGNTSDATDGGGPVIETVRGEGYKMVSLRKPAPSPGIGTDLFPGNLARVEA